MSVVLFALIALGGGLGAVLRVAVDTAVTRTFARRARAGLFVVNVSGSFLLGFVVGSAGSGLIDASWAAVIGAGVLGGYTTFSTAMVEALALVRDGRSGRALLSASAMLVLALLAAAAGLFVGRAL